MIGMQDSQTARFSKSTTLLGNIGRACDHTQNYLAMAEKKRLSFVVGILAEE
jgi:hypothetical protein